MNSAKDEVTVLIADDSDTVRDILESRLRREGYNVQTVDNGEEALKRIRVEPPDLAFLGVHMPYMKGTHVLRKVREDWDPTELPIMIMVDRGNTGDMARALDAGANDCIEKPINFNVTLSRMKTQLNLVEQHERVKSLVQYDTDTQLFNREFMIERLNVELSRVRRHGGKLMVMIVEFTSKDEEFPENLLEEIAEQMSENLRQTDVLGRYSDTEFGLVLPETESDYKAIISRRLMKVLSRRGITEMVSFAVGTATTDTGEPSAEELFETARENTQEFDVGERDQDQEAS